MLRVAIASSAPEVGGSLLLDMARALEEGARHMWEAWHNHLPLWAQDAPPIVFAWSSTDPLPPWTGKGLPRTVAMQFANGQSRNEGTLAVHFVAVDRPAARVYVDVSSGLNTGRFSAIESASHEMELMVNPFLDRWDDMPGQPGMLVAREVCDPVQTSYRASTKDPSGEYWQLANFVYPAFFNLDNPPGIVGFDHLGELSEPGEIGPEGYAILRDRNWRIRHVYGAGSFEVHGQNPGKPGGRSECLRGVAASRLREIVGGGR